MIYLPRHGEAEEGNGDDAARRLTEKGERQSRAAGRALAAGRGDVLLVGHEPDFSNEVARLTGGKVKLRKGGVAIIDDSTLLALLRPDDLAPLASSSD